MKTYYILNETTRRVWIHMRCGNVVNEFGLCLDGDYDPVHFAYHLRSTAARRLSELRQRRGKDALNPSHQIRVVDRVELFQFLELHDPHAHLNDRPDHREEKRKAQRAAKKAAEEPARRLQKLLKAMPPPATMPGVKPVFL